MANTRNSLTPQERDQIKAHHEAGTGCNAIAKAMGRAPSTIAKAAKDMGLAWDSSRTAHATEAKQAGNQARRAALVSRLYDRCDRIMDRLDSPTFKLVGMDKDGYARTNVVDQDAIPGAEERALFGMVVNGLVAAARLEQVDAGAVNSTEAKGILGNLSEALHSAYAQLAHTDTPTAADVERELAAEGLGD